MRAIRRGLAYSVRSLFRAVKAAVFMVGLVVVLAVAACLTPLPWKLYRWFSTDAYVLQGEPRYIVVLGGGGIPSESGLVRAYHGAAMARLYPDADVILALPSDLTMVPSEATQMKEELVLRGVAEERIRMETEGRNTREQAMRIKAMLEPDSGGARILLVSSPEHMKRALLTFRHLGFRKMAASAAHPESVKTDVTYDRRVLGGHSALVPHIGSSLTLRYRFWTNLAYVSAVARESVALGYYRLKGWI